jgi:hypothetical protein
VPEQERDLIDALASQQLPEAAADSQSSVAGGIPATVPINDVDPARIPVPATGNLGSPSLARILGIE